MEERQSLGDSVDYIVKSNNKMVDEEKRQRIRKSKRLLERHPDKVPVIIKPDKLNMSIVKFLPHKESKVSDFMVHLRGYTEKLKKSDTLLFFVSQTLPPVTEEIGELYKKYADSDGYLHVTLSTASRKRPFAFPSFGCWFKHS